MFALDVHTLDGRSAQVHVSPADSVKHIKELIGASLATPPDELTLIHSDVQLSNETLLSECEITNTSSLLALKGLCHDKASFLAKVAQEAEQYDEMAKQMMRLCGASSTLSAEEQDMLYVAFKFKFNHLRHAWKMTKKEEADKARAGEAHLASYAEEYCTGLASEMVTVCNSVVDVVKETLLPNAFGCDKALYERMIATCSNYTAEVSEGETKAEAIRSALVFYELATASAQEHLHHCSPVRLDIALHYAVFLQQILKQTDDACRVARNAYDAAIQDLEIVDTHNEFKGSQRMLQMLYDNVTMWTSGIPDVDN